MKENLKKAILVTLRYFDLFDYPLRKEEIFKWLFFDYKSVAMQKHGNNFEGQSLNEELDHLLQKDIIEEKEGFYFLAGRGDSVVVRKERKMASLLKIKKAQRMARIVGWMPGVKMIALCSNLGYFNAPEDADIDFFIVAKEHRIWTARFWSVAVMKFLRQRPNQKSAKDKICLSYFVSEEQLDLEKTKIGEDDIHLVYLLAQYLVVYSEDDAWVRFIEKNDWIKNYLPNFSYKEEMERFLIKTRFLRGKKLVERLLFIFPEEWYKKIQLKIMPVGLKRAEDRNDKKVIINDQMLKLHINDKREEIKDKIFNQDDSLKM